MLNELEVQVMETGKKVLGTERLDELRSMSDLVCTHKMQGQYEEAEELLISISNVVSTCKILGW